jgi:DNA-binding CsgD family transcriptional regulator
MSEKRTLSDREVEVALLVAEGLSVEEAAARLCISMHTVKAHLEHVYRKLGVSNRVQLVRILLEKHENQPNG